MLKINGKTFMNLQEAVQWLLDNNALPFQSSANYVANTEIGMGTIVNPSPAKVRIGSLIFFADSKVSTVIGLTENGFIVSDQYNDLVDDVVYVSNVALNASDHLIVTLSNGNTIDAGLIKQVTGFSINASQHLIVSYNDGTSTDLGAIFEGNVNIAGNFTADSIIENMSGYAFVNQQADKAWTPVYAGVVKNGNKITFVVFGKMTASSADPSSATIARFTIPASVGTNLYPYTLGGASDILDNKFCGFFDYVSSYKQVAYNVKKDSNTSIAFILRNINGSGLTDSTEYVFRIEETFLLSENLAS